MTRKNRTGMTLVELLVVITILGIMMSIAIPATMNALAKSRFVQCQNNIRQLGLGIQHYESSKRRFPGYLNPMGDYVSTRPTHPSHIKVSTWAMEILADVDRQDVHDVLIDPQLGWLTLDSADQIPGTMYNRNRMPVIQVFVCPSDYRNESEFEATNSFCANTGMWPSGGVSVLHSMSIQNGLFKNRFTPEDSRLLRSTLPGPYVRFPKPSAIHTFDRISDGLTNTAVLSENLAAGPWYQIGFSGGSDLMPTNIQSSLRANAARLPTGMVWQWVDDQGFAGAPRPMPVMKISGGDPYNEMSSSRARNQDLARPSSAHQGVVTMAFADGSARAISNQIEYRVYQALLTPSGSRSDVPYPQFIISDEAY